MTSWLASLCGLTSLCDVGEDLILAVNEAISNSAEHAYGGGPGTIVLRGRVQRAPPDEAADRNRACARLEVWIEIRDHGRWREPPADPGFRGRGLMMARASVDRLRIDCSSAGTVVTMQRALGCPVRALANA